MANEIIIRWGDGYVNIAPEIPEVLTKALKYWHRSMEYDERLHKPVSKGEYRQLYSIADIINEQTGQMTSKLTTMPGFVHKIKTILRAAGCSYRIVDERTPAPQPDFKAAFQGLRDYQYEGVYKSLMAGGGVYSAPTGYGKTHVIAAHINAFSHDELCARNTPTVVVAAPEKDITAKDFDDLVELLPDREVGIVMSGRKKVFSEDVQVITLNSLHNLPANEIGVLIIDEVHTAASEKRADTIMGARKALRWGVSATPDGRYDGRDLVTEGLFGPVVYHYSYAQGIKDGALVPIQVYWLPVPEPPIGLDTYLDYKTHAGKYRNGVDRNASHNTLVSSILNRVPESYQAMCIMRHLDQMDKIVPDCPGVKIVHAETSQENLNKRRYHNLAPVSSKDRRATYKAMADNKLNKVLSTYIYKQGVNFPELEVIINAGGGGSDLIAKQIPGRESRKVDEKSCAYLIDFWHSWDTYRDGRERLRYGPVLRDDRSREKAYTSLGFKQVWLNSIDEIPFLTK